MDSKHFDTIVKSFGTGASRRRVLRGVTATALGALGLGFGRAEAAPRTCVICQCGTGNPCNVKREVCQERREFSANVTCENFCARSGQRLCGTGSPFHCPQGCPA